jgi:hypothetical protein
MDGLTEGRMVHFVAENGAHLAAVVTRLWNADGVVNLNVQMPGDGDNGSYDSAPVIRRTSVRYSADPEPYTWHWIERA